MKKSVLLSLALLLSVGNQPLAANYENDIKLGGGVGAGLIILVFGCYWATKDDPKQLEKTYIAKTAEHKTDEQRAIALTEQLKASKDASLAEKEAILAHTKEKDKQRAYELQKQKDQLAHEEKLKIEQLKHDTLNKLANMTERERKELFDSVGRGAEQMNNSLRVLKYVASDAVDQASSVGRACKSAKNEIEKCTTEAKNCSTTIKNLGTDADNAKTKLDNFTNSTNRAINTVVEAKKRAQQSTSE